MLRLLVSIVAIAASLLAACGAWPTAPAAPAAGTSPSAASGAYTAVSPAELRALLTGKAFFFVNTHIPYEGEIEATDASIPFDQTAQRLDEYPADQRAPIVLYCRSGTMPASAAAALVQAGYTNVRHLEGGMLAWQAAGYTLLSW